MLAHIQWDGYVYKYGGTFGVDFNFSAGEENDGYWKVYAPGMNIDGQEGASRATLMTTTTPIDVTKFTKLHLESSYHGNNYYGGSVNFGLSTNNHGDLSMVRSLVNNSNGTGWSLETKSINISDLEGEYYIKFYMAVKGWDNKTLLIKNLYFE